MTDPSNGGSRGGGSVVVASAAEPWSVVVVASRETVEALSKTLAALVEAAVRPTRLDVVVNGNPGLVLDASVQLRFLVDRPGLHVRLWSIELADKANALNEYVHRLHDGAETVFFVDGYVRVQPNALARLDGALGGAPEALAATGVPSVGRSAASVARRLLHDGGLHGNLFALRGSTVQRFRHAGFRLPQGLYRTDSTIGAALSFGLDPACQAWDPLRFIAVCGDATWDLDPLVWWRPRDLLSHWHRLGRQARGDLENAAVRHAFQISRQPIGSLSPDVRTLISEWLRRDPEGASRRLKGHPLRSRALDRLLGSARLGAVAAAPARLAWERPPS